MKDDETDRLTPRQRECLEARDKYGSAKHVGRLLGISHHTVHMHWRLARNRLAGVPKTYNLGRSTQDVEDAPGRMDLESLQLLRTLCTGARHFFFWVGLLITISFILVNSGEGLLLMTGRGALARHRPKCGIERSDRPRAILQREKVQS